MTMLTALCDGCKVEIKGKIYDDYDNVHWCGKCYYQKRINDLEADQKRAQANADAYMATLTQINTKLVEAHKKLAEEHTK